ncbi:acetyl-CoA carboxylase biotin carboxyl carrier protein [Flavobacteriales bacterium]|jgi:acetyl-CoA carboxylase biotin carboxyl carrier protein|nr:acetyl-CoA carboxylase biotin carboxyl carrier protein [Flavobacteriales bacterium]
MALDIKEIQELIKFVAKSGVSEVDLEMGEMKISIKTPPKKGRGQLETLVQQIPVATASTLAPVAVQTAPVAVQAAPTAETPAAPAANDNDSNYITIKSPMIGTFYRKPSPDKDAFVSIGDEVSSGSVVCVVEAMKLFNEIESEVSGKIVKVLVDDMSPVEYDQPLFLVDPS